MPIYEHILEEMLFEDKIPDLSMFGQQIFEDDARILAKALAKDPELKTLDLGRGQFGDAGAKALAESLATNTHLKTLNLNTSGITDEGAKALAEGLAKNQTLEKLVLYSNDITDEGAIALADALKQNNSLKSLTLDYNRVGESGAQAIADAMGKHPLTSLGLGANCLGDDGAVAIAKAGKSLETLTLFRNAIGDEGAVAVAEHLFTKGVLQSLDISTNKIGDAGAKAMTTALSGGSALQSLLLSSNALGEEGMQAFADFLEKHDTLASLFLDKAFAKHTKGINQTTHKNMMQFTPADDRLSLVVDQNSARNKALCERLSLNPPHTVGDILMAGERLVAIRDITRRYTREFSPALPDKVETALANLPVLKPDFLEDTLTTRNESGLTPLDNPASWRETDKLLPFFDKAFLLDNQNRDGEPLLANAVYAGKFMEVLTHLNAQGEQLTPKDLLTEEKTPSPLLAFLTEKGELAQLFTLENWRDQSPQSLRVTYEALPDEGKAQVQNFHSLSQQVAANRASTQGIGRFIRS
ncbi:MAG: hypothetical protein FJX23_07060 [Alphaproteobacteria bacterium]|nr:hypothetical protein [Alphaproteobacteria bacterium]